MSTRLFVNLSQVYLPLYLQDTLNLPSTTLATVPLSLFVSGLFASLLIRPLRLLLSKKVYITFHSVICSFASFFLYLGYMYLWGQSVIQFVASFFFYSFFCVFFFRMLLIFCVTCYFFLLPFFTFKSHFYFIFFLFLRKQGLNFEEISLSFSFW